MAAGVVEKGSDLVKDKQLAHQGHHVMLEHPEIGAHHIPNWSFRPSEIRPLYRASSPTKGQHTEFVCKEILQMSDGEFVELLNEGVLE